MFVLSQVNAVFTDQLLFNNVFSSYVAIIIYFRRCWISNFVV